MHIEILPEETSLVDFSNGVENQIWPVVSIPALFPDDRKLISTTVFGNAFSGSSHPPTCLSTVASQDTHSKRACKYMPI